MAEHNRPEKINLSKKAYERKQRISYLTNITFKNCFCNSKCVVLKNNQYHALSTIIYLLGKKIDWFQTILFKKILLIISQNTPG